jgi:phosphoribosylanthranilate isomerase
MSTARRTIVKVCCITRVADAHVAIEAGADWVGVLLKGEGPRLIDVARARAISAAVDGAPVVAVMVGPTPEEALELARRAGATRVQLHRIDAFRWPEAFPLPVSVSVPVGPDGSLGEVLPPAHHTVLLDTADARRAGGTGRTFPWEAARVVSATRPVMIAGGLDSLNVAEAVARVRPYGVDASSRLESSPGIKDPDRVRRFVAAVRDCEDFRDA